MRLFVALVLLSLAPPVLAADASQPSGARAPDVDVIVPVDPHEHERIYWFGRRNHHLIPGTVTIDQEPYRCDVDGERFGKADDFEAHLRSVHRMPPERIPDALVVRNGLVHFIGDDRR